MTSPGDNRAAVDALHGVEAFLFDVFGTVVDWHGSVIRQLQEQAGSVGDEALVKADWKSFTEEWREGYKSLTSSRSVRIANGEKGPNNVDELHRSILDDMVKSQKWEHLAEVWNEQDRQNLVQLWHKLDGHPDSSAGLHALKKLAIIGTLSNGNMRLLIDQAKNADLPWDVIFSAELFHSYKPNPQVYLGAAYHLSIPPSSIAMVAAHIYDVRAAAQQGMKTVYVRRKSEDTQEIRDNMKSKAEGGEVDLVVDSLIELAEIFAIGRSGN